MTEELYANVSVKEYYDVNTTTAGYSFADQAVRGGVCANYTKAPYPVYINRSQELYPGFWKFFPYTDAIHMSVLMLFVIAGLIGNISVILTIVLNRSMRNTVNFYIANLAVADLMTCIFAPPAFYKAMRIPYVLGIFMCKLANFGLCVCMVSSLLTLSAISCDRFIAVFFPLHVRVTKQRKSLVACLIWIVSILVSIPYIIANRMRVTEWKDFKQYKCFGDWKSERYVHKTLGGCFERHPMFIAQTLFMTIFLYFLPAITMIIAYSLILWKLSRTKAPGEQVVANDNVDSAANKRVHKMVFTVLIVFVICWTPFQTGLLYDLRHPKRSEIPVWWGTFAWVAWLTEMGNSFMNPIIYAGMKKEFREGIRAVLRCRKPVLKTKPPDFKRRGMNAVNNRQQNDVNLEMEIKDPVADGR